MARRKQLKYNKKLLLPAAIIVIALVIAIIAVAIFYPELFDILFKGSPERPLSDGEPALEVHIMDVGQGDGIIVRLPDGKNMLIDAGGNDESFKNAQNGGDASEDELILNYIDKLGITVFDYVILTHSDEDHCSAMPAVIGHVEVKNFYIPKLSYGDDGQITTNVYERAVKAMEVEAGAQIHYNVGVFEIGASDEYTITNYCFAETYYNAFQSGENAVKNTSEMKNAVSPITIVEYGGREFMFTGDAVGDTDENFMNLTKGKDIDVDFLKVAHHGSATYRSNSLDFLSYIDPEYAFISAGVNNEYGHPSKTILNRLADYEDIGLDLADDDYDGIYETKITAQSGDLVIVIGKSGGFKLQ